MEQARKDAPIGAPANPSMLAMASSMATAPIVPATTPAAPAMPAVPTLTQSPAAAPLPGGPSPPPIPGPADPLAEAGDVVWYIRPPSGGQYGPANGQVMRSWIQEGRVSADSLVWREGWREWQEAGGVFPQLAHGTALPAQKAAPAPAETAAPTRIQPRRRSTTTQAVVIAVLVLAVIVLAVVFAWVLMQPPAAPDSNAPEAKATVMKGEGDRHWGLETSVRLAAGFAPRAPKPGANHRQTA